MRAPRGRSLFWTITGLFLVSLLVGTLLQALVADPVLRPLEARDARARAVIVASSLSTDLAALPADTAPDTIDAVLARRRAEMGSPARIYYRAPDGTLLGVAPSRVRFEIAAADSLRRLEGNGLRAAPEIGGTRGTGPPGFGPGGTGPRIETLVRRPVNRGSEMVGEITIVRPERPRGAPTFFVTGTWLLFIPIAMLTSVLAGLVVVRLLVRRLRGVETLAARVSSGDLSVRIADPSGDEIGRISASLDAMTERLASARDQLETTERQRRQLFADITHELATPLTSIRGYAETLLDSHVPLDSDERTRYVRGVLEESRRLDRLIRDLFELARLEAGAVPLRLERLDWAALCRNTVERFQTRFRDSGLALDWRGGPDQASVDADGHRLEEVLENLLANALRYVPRGGAVELAMTRENGRYRLAVSDDGPGVPTAELPLVFERFYRGTAVRGSGGSSENRGSGLGLAIVREIVERHGGRVAAAPRTPQGLTITVELPAV
ncbi:MAG TPA: HAMP domain-containing sensor histidine kinase [Dongiaceae bacterium]|nr:HAMP domain-containing sensor histidine kinase [Dongiaceae bacterium]